MSLASTTQVACPACGNRYAFQAHQAIDAVKEPHLKDLLLQGRFNVSSCPQCRNQGVVSLPFIYHDPDKSQFFMFMPMDVGRANVQQQQLVGALSNRFMSDLPPEERRGYMLQPKMYLSLQSLVDDILMADGTTREEIDAMRERSALLENLVASQSLEELQQKIEANQDKLDDAFFEVLDTWILQAEDQGDQETAQALDALRAELLQLVSPESESTDVPEVDREELMGLLLGERDPEQLRRLVAISRPVLDYQFFLALADRIEAAQAAGNEIESKRLTNVRATILQIVDELDAADREALGKAAEFLREAVQQENLESYLHGHSEQLDQAFFAVLNMNVAEANRRKDQQTVQALSAVGGIAMKVLEDQAPPAVRFVNQLLRAQPEERRRLLGEQAEILDDQMLEMLREMQAAYGQANPALAREIEAVLELVSQALSERQPGE